MVEAEARLGPQPLDLPHPTPKSPDLLRPRGGLSSVTSAQGGQRRTHLQAELHDLLQRRVVDLRDQVPAIADDLLVGQVHGQIVPLDQLLDLGQQGGVGLLQHRKSLLQPNPGQRCLMAGEQRQVVRQAVDQHGVAEVVGHRLLGGLSWSRWEVGEPFPGHRSA